MKKILSIPTGLATLAAAVGCGERDTLYLDEAFQLHPAVAVGTSVYLVHPFADKVVRVDAPAAAGEDAEASAVATGSVPASASATPSGEWVLVLHGDEDFLLGLPHPDGEPQPVDLGGRFNRLAYAPDGSRAVLYLAVEDQTDLTVDGSLTFDEVGVLDLGTGEIARTRVGFDPHALAFVPGSDRVVVLSSDRATVLDLDTLDKVEVPFTLDPDQQVTPSQVVVTDDGEHALITVEELPDLFDLRLVEPSINILSLSGRPDAMAVTPQGRFTVLVNGSSTVDVVDNLDPNDETTTTLTLDGRVDSVVCGEDATGPYALLYASDADEHLAHLLRPDTAEVEAFALENPAAAAVLSPDGRYAAVVHRQESSAPGAGEIERLFDGSHALSILDLEEGDSSPRAVEGPITDLEWVTSEAGTALVAAVDLAGWVETEDGSGGDPQPIGQELVRFRLPDLSHDVVPLPAPPTEVGALEGGSWLYVVHATGLGGVSFVEPAGTEVSTASGLFAEGIFLADPEAEAEGE